MSDVNETEDFEPLCGESDLYHEMFNASPAKPDIQVQRTADGAEVEYNRDRYRIERDPASDEHFERFRIVRKGLS